MVMSPQLSIVEAPKVRRVMRSPTHGFYIETKPFGIYPFCIAPVLPGETLKNLLLQSRVVTDPVASPLVGWWSEYYFFYVKLRDLPSAMASAVETMILDPSADLTGIDSTADSSPQYFAPGAGNAVPWVAGCLQSVTEAYFRDESEAWDNYTVDGVPLAKLTDRNWRDSCFAKSEIPTASTEVGAEAFEDFELRYRTWMMLRQQTMTDLTFEDYLATFGVNVPTPSKNKPELIRFCRDWSYPANTVDPTTGAPSSAVSWSVAERADKDRFFTEPGFIFGVTICRPKTYFATQKQSAVCMLDNALAWMPAILADDPASSLREFTAGDANSPMGSTFTVDHVVDVRDLYLYGDQFIRSDSPVTDDQGDAHMVFHVDDSHDGIQYPYSTSIAKLWVDRDVVEPAHTATKVWVRQDGIVKLNILGTQIDHT